MPHPSVLNSFAPVIGVMRHEKGDGAERVLAEFALGLRAAGKNIAGLVQRSRRDAEGRRAGVALIDIRTGSAFRISQELGAGSTACSLDTQGLAEASAVLRREIEAGVALLVVNQFGETESIGGGLVAETFEAISKGIPLLTSVATCHLAAWEAMTEGAGEKLAPTPEALQRWWEGVTG